MYQDWIDFSKQSVSLNTSFRFGVRAQLLTCLPTVSPDNMRPNPNIMSSWIENEGGSYLVWLLKCYSSLRGLSPEASYQLLITTSVASQARQPIPKKEHTCINLYQPCSSYGARSSKRNDWKGSCQLLMVGICAGSFKQQSAPRPSCRPPCPPPPFLPSSPRQTP